ncbi:MAG TPA: type VI secretion system tube protein TssD [candidate division Zixibacteria bacterium]|nr:type VI secretion system tube protein TssD [candidate division Zixibacteria bacterium]
MARRPVLEVDGVVYKNVYMVTYELYTAKDETGRPSDRAHAGTIKVTRESDENTDLARWAMDSSKPNWKAGKVTFKTPDDSEMKQLTWEEGFITRYEETIPHIKNNPDDQVFEHIEISCHKLTIGDAEIDNRWEE